MSYLSDLLGTAYREDMTLEEVSAALESANQSSAAEVTRLRGLLSTANSEAANYKKQLRQKQDKDEADEAERQEQMERLTKENAELKRNAALAERKSKLMGMGYDEQLASATATAMVDGDMDAVLANQSKYLDAQRKNIRTEQMRKTPRPAGGSEETGGMDYSKKIEEARANGDYSAMAYYTRLQATEEAEGGSAES